MKRFTTAILTSILFFFFAIPIHAEVTREQIKEVGKELACLCGDCPRRPLHECVCGYAQQQHERIKKMLASGQTPHAIVDAYVRESGLEILSKPPAKGFNLAAWLMPPFVLLFGFFVVRSVLRAWSKTKIPATPTAQPARDDPYFDRLESDLKERE